jgi:hypothetical protein
MRGTLETGISARFDRRLRHIAETHGSSWTHDENSPLSLRYLTSDTTLIQILERYIRKFRPVGPIFKANVDGDAKTVHIDHLRTALRLCVSSTMIRAIAQDGLAIKTLRGTSR